MKPTKFRDVQSIRQVNVRRQNLESSMDGKTRAHLVYTYHLETSLGLYEANLPILETELKEIDSEKREALASALAQGEIDRRQGRDA